MNDDIKEILQALKESYDETMPKQEFERSLKYIEEYITSLQQENKIKDTNWESLKYYLEKLYYKDYIEEAISDDIDKKIKELESKVNIKGYQKDIKALQRDYEELKERNNKAINYIKEDWYKLNTRDIEHIINLGNDIRIDLLDILNGDKSER